MSKRRYRPWNPDQMILFPQAMRDALDEGHIVFRIMDVVETLDIGCITERLEKKVRTEWVLVCLCGSLLKLVNSGAFQNRLALGMA